MVQAEWTSSLTDSHSCRCITFDRYPGIPCDSRWHWCCGTAGVRRVFSPRELRHDRILTSFPHGHHLDSNIPNLPRQISGLRELGTPSLLSSVLALHIIPRRKGSDANRIVVDRPRPLEYYVHFMVFSKRASGLERP